MLMLRERVRSVVRPDPAGLNSPVQPCCCERRARAAATDMPLQVLKLAPSWLKMFGYPSVSSASHDFRQCLIFTLIYSNRWI